MHIQATALEAYAPTEAVGRKTAASAMIGPVLAALFLATAILFTLFAAIWAYWCHPTSEAHDIVEGWTAYTGSVLAEDYGGIGWVRRGLGGTIAAALGGDWGTRVVRFHLLSLIALLVPLFVMQRRLWQRTDRVAAIFMALFLLCSPQTFLSWRNDIGRTDMLCLAMIAGAFVLAIDGRWKSAALLLGATPLLHETGLIFGVPMLYVVAERRLRDGTVPVTTLATAAAVLALTVGLCIAGPALLGPSSQDLARYMQRHALQSTDPPQRDLIDCAIYMMVAGSRGLRTAICYNRNLQLYPVMTAMSLFVALVSSYALGLWPARWRSIGACLVAICTMGLLANDTGRWVTFAVTALWLFSAWDQTEGMQLSEFRIASGPWRSSS